jgi:hypothetical protein
LPSSDLDLLNVRIESLEGLFSFPKKDLLIYPANLEVGVFSDDAAGCEEILPRKRQVLDYKSITEFRIIPFRLRNWIKERIASVPPSSIGCCAFVFGEGKLEVRESVHAILHVISESKALPKEHASDEKSITTGNCPQREDDYTQ